MDPLPRERERDRESQLQELVGERKQEAGRKRTRAESKKKKLRQGRKHLTLCSPATF